MSAPPRRHHYNPIACSRFRRARVVLVLGALLGIGVAGTRLVRAQPAPDRNVEHARNDGAASAAGPIAGTVVDSAVDSVKPVAGGAATATNRTSAPKVPPVPVHPLELDGGEIIRVHSRIPRGGLGELTGGAKAHRDAETALGRPAFATTIYLDAMTGETRNAAEVIARTVGANVRTLGGLGGFSALSVRGAPPGQTTMLIDGVPLSRTASVGADLGRFELSTLSEIAIYRGGVPASLGGAALGGAVDLRSLLGPGAHGAAWVFAAGLGSFGARHLSARWGGLALDEAGEVTRAYLVSASYRAATGDYPYFNDNGTNLTDRDDRTDTRLNNGFSQADLLARVRLGGASAKWELGSRTAIREQGVPGPGSDQAQTTSLGSVTQLFDATRTRVSVIAGRRALQELKLFAIADAQRYRDLDGEVGAGSQDRRYLSGTVGTIGSVTWSAGEAHVVGAGVDARLDAYRDADLMIAAGGAEAVRTQGGRLGIGGSISDEYAVDDGGRVIVIPALRVDVLHTRPAAETNAPVGTMAEPRTEVAPSPRLSALVHLNTAASLKGNVGYYFRSPTLAELYGDRGYLVGNSDLLSERGTSADLGVVWTPSEAVGALDRLFVEAVVFGAMPYNTIALVSGGGLVARPENVGDARILGAELTGSARLSQMATATIGYTGMVTEQLSPQAGFDGKALPRRPHHELSVRLDIARQMGKSTPIVWTDYTFASGSYLDLANLSPVPRRALVGAGAKLMLSSGLIIGVEVKNLTDERIEQVRLDPAPRPDLATVPRAISDYGGYPLPGRSLYATLEWHH